MIEAGDTKPSSPRRSCNLISKQDAFAEREDHSRPSGPSWANWGSHMPPDPSQSVCSLRRGPRAAPALGTFSRELPGLGRAGGETTSPCGRNTTQRCKVLGFALHPLQRSPISLDHVRSVHCLLDKFPPESTLQASGRQQT